MVLFGDENFTNSIANVLEITRQTAAAKLNGESEFTRSEIAIIAKHYKLTDTEIQKIFSGAKSVNVKEAAKLLGKSEQFVRISLQRGILPFGYAVKMSSKFTYHISEYKVYEYFGKVS